MNRNRLRRGRDRRWLHLEGLERRELLAGNLQVSVAGSKLFITGDDAANLAAVVALPNGRYGVAGLATTINGGNAPFVTNRAISHIVANLNGGDDALALTNDAQAIFDLANNEFQVDLEDLLGVDAVALQALIDASTPVAEFSLPGSLTVAAGAGDDVIGVIGSIGGSVVVTLGTADVGGGNAFGIDGSSLAAGNGVVGGGISIVGDRQADSVAIVSTDVRLSVSVALSDGANLFFIDDSNIGGGVAYTGGSGADIVSLVGGTNVRHSISAVLGSGINELLIDDSNVGGGLSVVGGAGDDSVQVLDSAIAVNVSLALGNGGNTVDFERMSTGAVAITGGQGADEIFAEQVTVRHGVSIATFDGVDEVTIQGAMNGPRSSIGGSLVIDTGSGGDTVILLTTNVAHSLILSLGSGMDNFTSNMVNIGLNATIDGGADKDIVSVSNTVVGFFLYAILGSGDDEVTIRTSAARAAYLLGGVGTMDRLDVDAATRNAVASYFASEFELFP